MVMIRINLLPDRADPKVWAWWDSFLVEPREGIFPVLVHAFIGPIFQWGGRAKIVIEENQKDRNR